MLDSTIAPNGTKSTSFVNLSPSEAHIYDRARYFARLGKKAGFPLRPKQIQLFLQPLADCDIVGSFFATVPKLAKGASGPNKRYSDRQTQRALASLRRKRLCSLYDVTARGVRIYLLYARPITNELAVKLEQQWEWRTTGFCASAVLSFAQNVTGGCQDVTHIEDPESLVLGSKTSTYTVSDQAAPLLESALQAQQTLQGGSLVGVGTDLCPWEGARIDPLAAAPKPAPCTELADTPRYTLSAKRTESAEVSTDDRLLSGPANSERPAASPEPPKQPADKPRINRWRSCECGECERCALEREVLDAKRRHSLPSRLVDRFRDRTDPVLDLALLQQLLAGIKAVERSYSHRPQQLRNFGRCLLAALAEDWSATFAASDAEAAAALAASRRPTRPLQSQHTHHQPLDLPTLPPTFAHLLERLQLPEHERAAWFGVVEAKICDRRLTIQTPSRYVTEWICSNYLQRIRDLDTSLDIEVITHEAA